ncbi:MAG: type IX secretion system membrane protein PorP/SprF [Deltaproteobacteria bacterium]
MRICIFLSLIISVLNVSAQQDVLSTQFMFNKLTVNPAFAGNSESAYITAIVRDQWTGLDGAPRSQALSVNFPKLGKVGLGININRQTVGVSEKLTVDGIYAYRFKVSSGVLSLGMSFSGRYFKQDFSDPHLVLIQPFNEDPAIEGALYSTKIFNVGFGAYFSNNRFYLGASVPRLIRADIDYKPGTKKSYEVRHLYFMTGGALDISSKIVVMPQLLGRWAENSPYNLDLNLGVLFYDRFYFASTLRTGGTSEDWFESADFIMGFHLNRNIFFAASYDLTMTPLRKYENGSLELLFQYSFRKGIKPIELINPRFF